MSLIDPAPLLQMEAEHINVLQDADDNIILQHGEGKKRIAVEIVADENGFHIDLNSGRWTAKVIDGRCVILVRPPRKKPRKKRK